MTSEKEPSSSSSFSFSPEFEDMWRVLINLKKGYDDNPENEPIKQKVLDLARYALFHFLSSHPEIPDPEFGAIEDGRLDIIWNGNGYAWFMLDEEDVSVHILLAQEHEESSFEVVLGENKIDELVALFLKWVPLFKESEMLVCKGKQLKKEIKLKSTPHHKP